MPDEETRKLGGIFEKTDSDTQMSEADELDMQSKKIINQLDPTSDQDGATKKYVDDSDHNAVTVTDTTSADITLTGQDIKVDVLPAGVDHDQLNNFVATEHINWTGASAGTIHATNYVDNDTITLTSFTGGNHKIIYTDGSGDVQELANGALDLVLTGKGTTTAPAWESLPIAPVPNWSATMNIDATSGGIHPQITTGDNLEFRDTAIHLTSATDGHLDYTADISHDFIIGSTEQIILKDGVLEPTTDNDVDLGSADKKVKEIFAYHTQTQPGRALSVPGTNNIYRNTTGHPIMVYGDVTCLADNGGINSIAYITLMTGSSSPPTTEVQRAGIKQKAFFILKNDALDGYFTFFMVVADDDYYEIISTTQGGATVTLTNWNEVDF
jgi:hypothetical protein